MQSSINILANLQVARQGMMAQQAGMSVVGQNVTNVNTEGYTRKRLITSAMPGYGGVEVTGIKRYADQFATKRLIAEETLLGFSKQKSNVLGHISDLFNDLQDTGLGASFDNFFGSIRTLESNPSDLTSRQEVLSRGHELASAFNRIADELETIRRGMDDQLRASAAEVNQRTERIAELNSLIAVSLTKGDDASDLQDSRDRMLREIAEHVNITHVENSKGEVTVFLEGGNPIVEGKQFSSLFVNPMSAPGSAQVEYVAPNGTVSNITSFIKGGAMGGTLEARDTDIPSYQAEFDQLAFDIATAFNSQHSAGFGLDGVGGRNFFTPLGAVANAAASVAVDADVDGLPENIAAASVATDVPGDNRNVIAMADLAEQLLAQGGSMTFNESYATVVGKVGVDSRRANDAVAMRDVSIANIEALRDTESGVSLDEELTQMIAYQRAYQASARVLSAIDEILQTLMAI